jgi:hypothetical protein
MGAAWKIGPDGRDDRLPIPVEHAPSSCLEDALRRSALSLEFQPQFGLVKGEGGGPPRGSFQGPVAMVGECCVQ